jgi:hypothetical protein
MVPIESTAMNTTASKLGNSMRSTRADIKMLNGVKLTKEIVKALFIATFFALSSITHFSTFSMTFFPSILFYPSIGTGR